MSISTLKSKVSFVCLSLLLQLSLAASVTQELKLSSQRALLLSRNLDGEEPDHDGEDDHDDDHDEKPWGTGKLMKNERSRRVEEASSLQDYCMMDLHTYLASQSTLQLLLHN